MDTIINDIFDQLSKILKNDQKYSFEQMGGFITAYMSNVKNVESFYVKYPPLLDVAELSAALEYEGSGHKDAVVQQIRYKMSELKHLLPDIR